jgi:hypothetical protein
MGFQIGVGINTGVALAGAVGPEEQEYTVIGDSVNLTKGQVNDNLVRRSGRIFSTSWGRAGSAPVEPLVSLILGLKDPGLWPKPLVLWPRDKGDTG